MQYQVPQFIETEDKIIGPLTLKQFLIASGGVLVIFLSFFIFTPFLAVLVSMFIGTLTAVLAFVRYNGRPITSFIGSALNYFFRPRLYVWKRKEELEAFRAEEAKKVSALQNLWLRVTAGKEDIGNAGVRGTRDIEERMQIIKKTTGEQRVARRVDYR
ncbi:MAG: PrgI family protein [Candidatus Harrisonbacteria bacterium]|nr:PrgI family protein [Candidatus Harrisonbacteria bacterium]